MPMTPHKSNRLMLALWILVATLVGSTVTLAEEAAVEGPKKIPVFGELMLEVPQQFKPHAKRSGILDHEFQVKAGEGADAKTARVTMMASGGGVKPNLDRWKGQFTGGKAEDQKVEVLQFGDWKVHIADNSGNFTERMGGGGPFAGGKKVKRTDYAMTGAILQSPQGRLYFVKMVGPQTVVKANRKAFMEMINSIGEATK